jgi:hypothetical protein
MTLTKELFVNSLISAIYLVILVIIFEIIFFFFKIKTDIEANSLRLIDKIPDIPIDKIISMSGIKNENQNEIITNMKSSLEDLVSDNQTKLKNRRTKSIIIISVLIIIFTIITILMTMFFQSMIDFKKLIAFVILTFVIVMVCEIIFYFEVFSKIKTTNDDRLLIELYKQLTSFE